jgi:hypothetical protein
MSGGRAQQCVGCCVSRFRPVALGIEVPSGLLLIADEVIE